MSSLKQVACTLTGQSGNCGGTADVADSLQGCSPHSSSCEKPQSVCPGRGAGQVIP